jgi:hypothetical protein
MTNKTKALFSAKWISDHQIEIWLLLSLMVTFAFYSPSLHYDFIYSLDDEWLITNNENIKHLSWERAKHLFFSDRTDLHYHPMTYLSLSFDYYFFGLDVYYYKLHNLLLHLANGVLIYWFILLLYRNKKIAVVTAILFLIAAMNIESITWASCRRQSLSMFYLLLSSITYLKFLASNEKAFSYYVGSIALFSVSVLSKSSGVIFPAVVVLLYYFHKKESFSLKSIIYHTIPFALLSIFFVYQNLFIDAENFLKRDFNYSASEHIVFIFYSLGFYLYKFIVSFPLGIFYPAPPESADILPTEYYLIACLGFFMVAGTAYFFLKRQYDLFLPSAIYFFTTIIMSNRILFPFSDLPIIVSDRYFYHNGMWIILFMVIIIFKFGGRFGKLMVTCSIIISQLFFLHAYLPAWTNSITLMKHLVHYYPSEEFYYRLGIELFKSGKFDEAVDEFGKAKTLGTDIWINNHWLFYFEKSLVYVYDNNCSELQFTMDKMVERNVDETFLNSYKKALQGKVCLNEFKGTTDSSDYPLKQFFNERIILKSSQ